MSAMVTFRGPGMWPFRNAEGVRASMMMVPGCWASVRVAAVRSVMEAGVRSRSVTFGVHPEAAAIDTSSVRDARVVCRGRNCVMRQNSARGSGVLPVAGI